MAMYRQVEGVDVSAFDVTGAYNWIFYTSPTQDEIYVENDVNGALFELFVEDDELWDDPADLYSIWVEADEEV